MLLVIGKVTRFRLLSIMIIMVAHTIARAWRNYTQRVRSSSSKTANQVYTNATTIKVIIVSQMVMNFLIVAYNSETYLHAISQFIAFSFKYIASFSRSRSDIM